MKIGKGCKKRISNVKFISSDEYIKSVVKEFNDEMINTNKENVKKQCRRGLNSFLNNLVNNEYNTANILNKHGLRIDELKNMVENGQVNIKGGLRDLFGHKPNDPSIKKAAEYGIPLYDAYNKVYRKSTLDDIKVGSGYEYDEILSFKNVIMDEKLLENAIIIYGDPDKAVKAIMGGEYYKNQQFLPKRYNASKGDSLGSSDDAFKFLKKEDPYEREQLQEAHVKLETEIKNDLNDNALSNKLKNKIETLKNIVASALLSLIVEILNDEIMDITAEIMLREPETSVKDILLKVAKGDRLNKFLLKIYNTIKDIKNFVCSKLEKFIDSMSDTKEFLNCLVVVLISGVATFIFETCTEGFSSLVRIIIKGFKLSWSLLEIAKEYNKYLNDKTLPTNERFKMMKDISIKIIKCIADYIDVFVNIILTLLTEGLNLCLNKFFFPLLNAILYFVSSLLSFILIMSIDILDKFDVNKNNRTNYINSRLY